MIIVMWIKVLIALLGVITVLLLFGTKVVNWETVDETAGESYNEATVYGIILIGICSTAAAVLTFFYFRILSIVSLGLGLSALAYGLHIASCKGMLFFVSVPGLFS